MKVLVKRACGHEEKIKVYTGMIKSDSIIAREALKNCRICGNKKKA